MKIPSDEWLIQVNRDFRAQNVDIRRRPFMALDRYCQDYKVRSIMLNSPAANRIFEWFTANAKQGAHNIGSLFTGAYYYDACFWAVEIPIGYGTFKLEAPDSLRGMPQQLKQELLSSQNDALSYALSWVDCLDYAFGYVDMFRRASLNQFGLTLLKNADRELQAAISQLLEHRPNPKAAMSSRMAVEIYLKAFLVLKSGLGEAAIKKFGHRLNDLISECQRVSPGHDLLHIEPDLKLFPEISDRYTGDDLPHIRLWQAYGIAQYCAVSTVRSFTNRDTRSKLHTKPNRNN